MKKLLSLILVICMIVAVLASCDINGGKQSAESEKPSNTEKVTDTTTETEANTEKNTESEPASESKTEPDSNTEKNTESDTEKNTETDKTTEPGTESDTETEASNEICFKDKYSVNGSYANMLKDAIKSEKLPSPSDNASLVIYVGEADAKIVTAAKALLTAPNGYHNFAIVATDSELAIYATSEYAINNAIDYLIENYTAGGYIAVPKNLQYTFVANLPDIRIDGKTLDSFTVTANSDLADVAGGFAEDLTFLTGFNVAYAQNAEGALIRLVATGSGTSIANGYTLSYSDSVLTVTAQNKTTLAYALSNLIDNLKFGLNITEGYSRSFPFSMKTEVATNTELFKYCGTWQATDAGNPTTMVSYWDAAYVEVDFTGNAITLMFSSATTFFYRIDDGAYTTVSNITGDYTVFANGGGTHTVRILYNDKDKNMYFAGVKVEENVTLSRTPDRKYYIQFVGDSISDATNSFSHNSADIIDWDYSVIACEALSLVKDMGYWRYNNGFANNALTEGSMAWYFKQNFNVTSVGMEDAFFKLGIPNKWSSTDPRFNDVAAHYYTEKYDFNFQTGNTPDIVFIFLGTNDMGLTASQSVIDNFVATYKSFVAKILATYGADTEIVVMQALSTSNSSDPYNVDSARYTAIRRVASELKALYPDNVTFLDENTLFSWGVDISSDGTHPSADGYATLSEKVAAWLAKKFK